jgi:hypothetical protein
MAVGYLLFLQEQIKGIIIIIGCPGAERRVERFFPHLSILGGVCLVLQYLLVEDMCYKRRRAEACVD